MKETEIIEFKNDSLIIKENFLINSKYKDIKALREKTKDEEDYMPDTNALCLQ